MKTLKKLTINPRKLLTNEELVNLRGGYGYDGGNWCCEAYGTSQGDLKFCDDDISLVKAWESFWSVNYHVYCSYKTYA